MAFSSKKRARWVHFSIYATAVSAYYIPNNVYTFLGSGEGFLTPALRDDLSLASALLSVISFIWSLAREAKLSAREIKPTLKGPAGWRLRDLAETVFSRKTYTTILEPILRDLYDEYCEALKEGKFWKARFVCLRGYWSFWSAVLAQLPASAFKVVSQIWKAIP